MSTAPLLSAFDEAWVTYLEQFAAWKGADAASLEVWRRPGHARTNLPFTCRFHSTACTMQRRCLQS